jgi:hypothetical protein
MTAAAFVLMSVVIALSGCASSSRETPLPPEIRIVSPGPDVPEPAAAFSGVWKGRWDVSMGGYGGNEQTLIVRQIKPPAEDACEAAVLESWGQSHEYVRRTGRILVPQGVLELENVTYSIAADRASVVAQLTDSPSADPFGAPSPGTVRALLRRIRLFPDAP